MGFNFGQDAKRRVVGGGLADAAAGAVGMLPDSVLSYMLAPLQGLRTAASLAQGRADITPSPFMPHTQAAQRVADRVAPQPTTTAGKVTRFGLGMAMPVPASAKEAKAARAAEEFIATHLPKPVTRDGLYGISARELPDGFSPVVMVEQKRPGAYDVLHKRDKAGEVTLDRGGAFVDRAQIAPEYQRQGIGSAAYDAIEQQTGRRLISSPLGLSEAATGLWRKRLGAMSPADRDAALNEALDIGRGYGIRDEHLNMRLDPLRSK